MTTLRRFIARLFRLRCGHVLRHAGFAPLSCSHWRWHRPPLHAARCEDVRNYNGWATWYVPDAKLDAENARRQAEWDARKGARR